MHIGSPVVGFWTIPCCEPIELFSLPNFAKKSLCWANKRTHHIIIDTVWTKWPCFSRKREHLNERIQNTASSTFASIQLWNWQGGDKNRRALLLDPRRCAIGAQKRSRCKKTSSLLLVNQCGIPQSAFVVKDMSAIWCAVPNEYTHPTTNRSKSIPDPI